MKINDLKLKQHNIKGYQVVELILKGHVLRRPCWKEGVFIRLCNESGFNEEGIAFCKKEDASLYTCSTEGYFMHIGFSQEPINGLRGRSREGLRMFLDNDWEDYGILTSSDFKELEDDYKKTMRSL